MLLFGPPGSGKSRLIGNGAGPRTLIMRPPTDHLEAIDKKPLPLEAVVTNWVETTEVLEYVAEDRGKELDWFWWDSISLFQDIGLDDVYEAMLLRSRNPERAEFGPDQGEYGTNMRRIQKAVRDLVAVPNVNIGLTAHPVELVNPDFDPDDDDSSPVLLQPWIQGKGMVSGVCGCMQTVLYLFERRGGRILTSRSDGRYYVKDQFNKLPPEGLKDPSWEDLDRLYRAELRAGTPRAATPRRRVIVNKNKGR